MPKHTPSTRFVAAVLASSALAGGAAGAAQAAGESPTPGTRASTDLVARASATFAHPTRITNPWLPLSVHREAVFVGRGEDGADTRVLKSVLRHTKTFVVDGRPVRTVPVEARTFEDGVLREVSLAYYAEADDGTVYELGRDVHAADAVDHRGTSSLGRGRTERGARIVMPAAPRDGALLGDAGARVVDTNARLTVAAGTFNRVLVVQTAPSGDGAGEMHYFARGVGLLKARTATGALDLANLR